MSEPSLQQGPKGTNAVWRSLEELEDSDQLADWIKHEFPQGAEMWGADHADRRDFLKLMAASLALAGINGCSRAPEEKIVPTVKIPDQMPHQSFQYATAMPMSGGAIGVLVTSRDGRPLKIEGNPAHPASLGSTDIFAQAAILDLYDPDRSRFVKHQQQVSSWSDFLTAFSARSRDHSARKGQGLRVLSPPILSPTLEWQRQQLQMTWPEAKWHVYEPINDDYERAGTMLACGEDVRPRCHFEQAQVIVAIDADFLGSGPGKVRYARDFMNRRKTYLAHQEPTSSRLYCVESTPSLTGAVADHRWPLAPDDLIRFTQTLAHKLGLEISLSASDELPGLPSNFWTTLVADLKSAGQRALVAAGYSQPAAVHALVHAINHHLGNLNQTVTYHRPVAKTDGEQQKSLADLVDAMRAGTVESLLVFGSNPIYDSPVDLAFRDALRKVTWTVHLGVYADETSSVCTWHVPEAHFLESWGDAWSLDGTISLIQPLIAPLHEGRSIHDLMNVLLETPRRSAYETVRDYWRGVRGSEGFETLWQQSLHDGVVPETALPVVQATMRTEALAEVSRLLSVTSVSPKVGEIHTAVVRPHPTLWDGRFANNGWLQELPQPFSTLTWSNVASIAPADAAAQQLHSGDVVEVTYKNKSLRVPIWILPGQAVGVMTLQMGGGRTEAGRLGSNVGYNVFKLRSTHDPWKLTDLHVRKTGDKQRLPATQQHFLMEGRELVKVGTWQQYQDRPQHPEFMGHESTSAEQNSFYAPSPTGTAEQQWGMSIDLGSCIGCNACVIACQSENNIPIVGSMQVSLGREMHWLRVATYFTGSPDAPQTYHQPIPCMHCEHAPCEVVCPVSATTHSKEGLNEMTYNRCVGTRYCSNNCPYKVRRFNFLDYQTELRQEPLLQLLPNPEVTVRSRGVMEKCTYCVQRISAARIQAGLQDRLIKDGEIVTACQAVCPTEAIRFGDISDPHSEVANAKRSSLSYSLLAELNTRPRTTYLAALRNPHPDLVES